jgi:response regulator RpfG family c-di-GMP phosphodiesterase
MAKNRGSRGHHAPSSSLRLRAAIAYSVPAPGTDTPYFRHEKWDGSGYTRSLQCEQIPLSARIYAVADVWDALRSDRPQGRAWPEEEVQEYLREQALKHFDPQVVGAFVKLI